MNHYRPAGAEPTIPPALEHIFRHPERRRWQAAFLLYRSARRWPEWPYEFALATVDSRPQVYVASFMIQPPWGWAENDQEELSPEILRGVREEGLLPRQAMIVLNEILGGSRAYTYTSLMIYRARSNLEEGSGVRAAWTFHPLMDTPGDSLRIRLTEKSRVDFLCPLPEAGSLSERVRRWAEEFVGAGYAHRLLVAASRNAALVSEVLSSRWDVPDI